ncbi:hypothetical protein EDC01DRAFT_673230 [Geopyxis carbonaria]|nr:hypothetical protein EDC01DRAFT_673230 [Geopyxis carbonaria]
MPRIYLRSILHKIMSNTPPKTAGAGTTPGLPASHPMNVYGKPLLPHSLNPPTGFMRNGFCHAPSNDPGNHSIAGIVTDQFLSFSAARGNDLRKLGLKEGCRWCLCVTRWKEAYDAYKGGEKGIAHETVPRVVLEASGQRALEGGKVTIAMLEEFKGGDGKGERYWLSGGKQQENTMVKDAPIKGGGAAGSSQ